ncbi:hypothetical protein Pan216_42280 [Planctomycetes bacterium Pan216]|uniref:DUF1559 domain-containing protein n=1 Tax=Kolteria novifilia TaxID=2527975 RepID=A0A518B8R1_9BACT|nr:hypothetical protein Pan216_42280 [Planctomycetes bacterium Pan216]
MGESKRGLRWIDVVVLFGIGLVALTMLMTTLGYDRTAERRTLSKINLKLIGLAMLNYHDAHKTFPPGLVSQPDGFYVAANNAGRGDVSSTSGWTLILPFLEEKHIWKAYNFELGCAHPANKTAVETVITRYVCPSSMKGATRFEDPYTHGSMGPTDYVLNMGAHQFLTPASPFREDSGFPPWLRRAVGPFNINSHCPIARMRDGTSNTFLVGEGVHGLQSATPEGKGTIVLNQGWAQGYISSPGNGPAGSIFAATARETRYDEEGNELSCEPLPHVTPPTSTAFSLWAPKRRAISPTWYPTSYVDGLPADATSLPAEISVSPFRSVYPGVVHFLYADGSVKSVSDHINPRLYRGLSTVAGNEVWEP